MSWTKEYRAAYMRAYREKHPEWLRVTYAIWYKANRKKQCPNNQNGAPS